MLKDSLAKKYARKFCEEYDSPNTKVRLKEIGRIVSDNGSETVLVNGEYAFGPHQTWPAQLDDFTYLVSRDHSHRKIDYETFRNILLLEHPEIPKRNYISQQEYEYTVQEMFSSVINGMKMGKLERIFKRKMEEEERNTPGLLRPFVRSSNKRKIVDSLRPIIDRFYEDIPNYSYKALSFDNNRAA